MSRPLTQSTPIDAPQPTSDGALLLAREHDAMNAGAMAIAEQYGYEGSLTVGALEDEIRFYQRRSVEAVLALGTRLLILKELTAHGEFTQRVNLLGINERMARRFMSATLKFGKTDTKSVLIAAGSQTKMLELLVLDDGEISELASGGSAANLTLDDVERMSASELRAALREARANEEATGRIMAEKNAKIDDLATKLERQPAAAIAPRWDERLIQATEEMAAIGRVAEEAIPKLLVYTDICETLAGKTDGDTPEGRAQLEQVRMVAGQVFDQIERLASLTARVRADFDARAGWLIDRSNLLPDEDA